ncbi:MAG: hypothetical protein AAB731_00445 [Patescibacteria group bacterium]
MKLQHKIGYITTMVIWSIAAKVSAVEALPNPLGTTDVYTVIGRVIKAALGLTGALALLMFIWGGFLWMTAMGDARRVEKGRDTMVWATLGLVVIFGSYAITSFIIEKFTK